MPTPFRDRKAIRRGASARVPRRSRAVGDPSMYARTTIGNREIFGSAANGLTSGPHRGGLSDRSR
jgi:hypothetical protein